MEFFPPVETPETKGQDAKADASAKLAQSSYFDTHRPVPKPVEPELPEFVRPGGPLLVGGRLVNPNISRIEKGATATLDKCKAIAESGATVIARQDATIFARTGSTVHAEKGSVVHVEKGANVFAKDGCTIIPYDGSSVNAPKDPTIHQEKGSKIEVPYKAKVAVYKDAVVETTYGEVDAYDGAVVYAKADKAQPTYPPIIHAKGKCTINAFGKTNFDADPGIEATLKGWDGKR